MLEVAHVSPQHPLALLVLGGGDGLGPHGGVAVHVAPHPGGKTQQGWQGRALAPDLLEGFLEGFEEHRQHAIQRVAEVVAHLGRLVGHGRLLGRGALGLPTGRERGADHLAVGARLCRCSCAVDIGDEDGYIRELRHIVECIREGRAPSVVTAEDGLSAVEICEAEEQSAEKGLPVEF